MMGLGMGMMGGGFSLIIWVILIVGIIYYFSNHNRNQNNNDHRDYQSRKENRAVEIAKERYAKGEISKEELDKILRDIQ